VPAPVEAAGTSQEFVMSHPQLKGRIALVTSVSATGPLTLGLASRGATVVVAMRNEACARTLADQIARVTGNPNVHPIELDLASFPSVRRAAAHFIARYHRLHVLVTDTMVRDSVDHLGPLLLANLLLDTMKQSGSGRIIRLASATDRQQIWSA
jgi:NAD(P)-dependent dehydrogenase (short-subunit alcohol dehydrogenase family)